MKFLATCITAIAATAASSTLTLAFAPSATRTTMLSSQTRMSNSRPAAVSLSMSSVEEASVGGEEFEELGLPARPGRPLKVAIAGASISYCEFIFCDCTVSYQ